MGARFTTHQCRVMAWLENNEFCSIKSIAAALPDLGEDRVRSAVRSLQRRGLVGCYRGSMGTTDPAETWGRGCYATWAGDEFDDPVKAGRKDWLIAHGTKAEAA